jgi:hypothetical protein
MSRNTALISQVNWLYLSQEDMRKAREIIAAAGPDSTVDVLGLGNPAEKISDLLFPGTSTLHTELRYVIFTPAILYAMKEKGGVPDPFGMLKRKEAELIISLQKGGETTGVIGRTRGEELRYWPSITYWTAFNAFETLGSGYYDRGQVLEKLSSSMDIELVSDDGDATVVRDEAFVSDPEYRAIALSLFKDIKDIRWPDKMDFKLKKKEADFLKKRLHTKYPRSLYIELLNLGISRLKAQESLFDLKPESKDLAALLKQAERYSLFAMGATLAYRWELCRDRADTSKSPKVKDDWKHFMEKNEELYLEWREHAGRLKNWNVDDLSESVAKAFSENLKSFSLMDDKLTTFCRNVHTAMFEEKLDQDKLKKLGRLARDREENMKGNRSRFRDRSIAVPENVRPSNDVQKERYLYTYRWFWGKANALAILEGLVRK